MKYLEKFNEFNSYRPEEQINENVWAAILFSLGLLSSDPASNPEKAKAQIETTMNDLKEADAESTSQDTEDVASETPGDTLKTTYKGGSDIYSKLTGVDKSQTRTKINKVLNDTRTDQKFSEWAKKLKLVPQNATKAELDQLSAQIKSNAKENLAKLNKSRDVVDREFRLPGRTKGHVGLYRTFGQEKIHARSPEEVKELLNKGYYIDGWEIDSDTTVVGESKGIVGTRKIEITFESDNLFITGKSELKKETIDKIQSIKDSIAEQGGVIDLVKITAGTDKEPAPSHKYLGSNPEFTGTKGNWALAANRAESVATQFGELGPESIQIEAVKYVEAGPDIYTKTMSTQERTTARTQTAEHRFVKLDLFVTITKKTIDVTEPIQQIDQEIDIVLGKIDSKIEFEGSGGHKATSDTSTRRGVKKRMRNNKIRKASFLVCKKKSGWWTKLAF